MCSNELSECIPPPKLCRWTLNISTSGHMCGNIYNQNYTLHLSGWWECSNNNGERQLWKPLAQLRFSRSATNELKAVYSEHRLTQVTQESTAPLLSHCLQLLPGPKGILCHLLSDLPTFSCSLYRPYILFRAFTGRPFDVDWGQTW